MSRATATRRPPDCGEILLRIARAAIAEEFGEPRPVRPAGAWLDEPGAVFVTLHEHGELRGCIGTLRPRASLYDAVVEAARSAAFRDPRFPGLQPYELPLIHIEISLLSPIEELPVDSEDELLAKMRVGKDGLILSHGGRLGVFIPEMWKQLPEPDDFLYHLKRKAGLPTDRWLPGTRVERFTAELFAEPTDPIDPATIERDTGARGTDEQDPEKPTEAASTSET
ncbi:MAG: AmmeMemoRadiSam system protein A [Polyangia bacterium]